MESTFTKSIKVMPRSMSWTRHLEDVVTECRRDLEQGAAPEKSGNIGKDDSDVFVAPVDIVAS